MTKKLASILVIVLTVTPAAGFAQPSLTGDAEIPVVAEAAEVLEFGNLRCLPEAISAEGEIIDEESCWWEGIVLAGATVGVAAAATTMGAVCGSIPVSAIPTAGSSVAGCLAAYGAYQVAVGMEIMAFIDFMDCMQGEVVAAISPSERRGKVT